MSFSVGIFSGDGKDVLLGVDRRWVEGAVGAYTVASDEALKSVALNRRSALAFTGHAELIAGIVSNLYGDPSLADLGTEVLEELETREALMGSTDSFVRRLDTIIPEVRARFDGRYDLSVILAGRIGKHPVMVWWALESDWKGRVNYFGQDAFVPTFPKETERCDSAFTQGVDILRDYNSPADERIRRAIGLIASKPGIVSVNDRCVIRRLSNAFTREEVEAIAPSTPQEPAPSSGPSPGDASP